MWNEFEWDAESVPGLKLVLHILQIIFAFVCWALEISVFRSNGSTVNGQVGWPFAVCFLSIPAWIYLIGAPRFPRTRRFALPQAMVAVDALFVVLWLSAWASQASYDTANLCGDGCGQSKAIVGLGIFVMLFFGATTFLSIYTLKVYQMDGRLPGYDKTQVADQNNIDPDKAAFSMAPHDEEAYAPVHMDDQEDALGGHHSDAGGYHSEAGGSYNDGGYGLGGAGRAPSTLGGGSESHYGAGPSGAGAEVAAGNPFDDDRRSNYTAASSRIYAPPSAADDYDEDGPAKFPAANYDRVH